MFFVLLGLLLLTTLIAIVLIAYEFKIYHNTDGFDEQGYDRHYNICKIVTIIWIILFAATLFFGKFNYDSNKKDYVKGFVGLYQYINYVDTTKDYEHYAEVLEHLSTQNEDLLIFVTAGGHKLKPEQSFELLKIYLVSNELQQTQIINTLKN